MNDTQLNEAKCLEGNVCGDLVCISFITGVNPRGLPFWVCCGKHVSCIYFLQGVVWNERYGMWFNVLVDKYIYIYSVMRKRMDWDCKEKHLNLRFRWKQSHKSCTALSSTGLVSLKVSLKVLQANFQSPSRSLLVLWDQAALLKWYNWTLVNILFFETSLGNIEKQEIPLNIVEKHIQRRTLCVTNFEWLTLRDW